MFFAGHGVVYIAKQRFEAIGPRQSRILSFDKGDELLVVNPVQGSEWWEATSLHSGKIGEVPSSYLIRKEENPDQMRYTCMYEKRTSGSLLWCVPLQRRRTDKDFLLVCAQICTYNVISHILSY